MCISISASLNLDVVNLTILSCADAHKLFSASSVRPAPEMSQRYVPIRDAALHVVMQSRGRTCSRKSWNPGNAFVKDSAAIAIPRNRSADLLI